MIGKIILAFMAILFISIPIARADHSSPPTTFACVTPSSCPKDQSICYAPVPITKPTTATFAAFQKSYTPPGFDKNTQLSADAIFASINTVRTQAGLPAFEKNEALCTLAASRAPELGGEVASGRFHSGLYNRNLPYWVTENMKYGSNEGETVNWWLHSPIHRAAIFGNSKFSCGVCVGNACAQLFTSFIPK